MPLPLHRTGSDAARTHSPTHLRKRCMCTSLAAQVSPSRSPTLAQYEPEVVPGAIIRIPDTHGCLTIFDSGKVLISGVRNRTEAVALWHAFKRVCFGVPPPTATTPSSATQRPPT
ncbi:hypothetical protein EON67_04295, partial [archaeon]